MIKLLITLTTTLGVLSAVSDTEWVVFKAKYGKSYGDREDFRRRMIYRDNLKKIKSHNEKYAKGESAFFLGENQFADMTNAEFVESINKMKVNKPHVLEKVPVKKTLPQSVDWREKGYVTPVKNQGACQCSWAFSATGALEGQHFNKTGKLVSLSESNLIDCSQKFGNLGCSGGSTNYAFNYIIANKGINAEASYPYAQQEKKCKFNSSDVAATIKSVKYIKTGSESALQEAVVTVGPVSVIVDASHESFQFYTDGVYTEPWCSSTILNRAMLVVGYQDTPSANYWLVKKQLG